MKVPFSAKKIYNFTVPLSEQTRSCIGIVSMLLAITITDSVYKIILYFKSETHDISRFSLKHNKQITSSRDEYRFLVLFTESKCTHCPALTKFYLPRSAVNTQFNSAFASPK